MSGQKHAPKVYELVERQAENPAIKADMSIPYLHVYDTYAIACDGKQTIRVYLTQEQLVQIAADVTEIASKILRWEAQDVRREADKDASARPDREAGG